MFMSLRRGLVCKPNMLSYGATRLLSQPATSFAESSEVAAAAPWLLAPRSLDAAKSDTAELIELQLPLPPIEPEKPVAWISGWQRRCDSSLPSSQVSEGMALPSASFPTRLGDDGPRPLPLPQLPSVSLDIDGTGSLSQPIVVVPPPSMDESRPTLGDPAQNSGTAVPLLCFKYAPKRRKSQGLEEKWWLEFDPPKNNYLGGQGRGPFGGNSITKSMWQRQMVPIRYNQRWERRERTRFAFRKNGFEVDVPKWGG